VEPLRNAEQKRRSARTIVRSFAASPSDDAPSATDDDDAAAVPTATYRGTAGEFHADSGLFPSFESIGVSSPTLLRRLERHPALKKSGGRPSAVQAAAYPAIALGSDAVIGAETGSGKTLAYLLPLVDDVLERKRKAWEERNADNGDSAGGKVDAGYSYARAVILVPNKELAQQAVRMAAVVCGGERRCVVWGGGGGFGGGGGDDFGAPARVPEEEAEEGEVPEHELVRIAIMPGGLSAPEDFQPFRAATAGQNRQPPPDIVVATPAALGPMALSPKNIGLFADVQTLIVDEADMLLDGGYVRPLNDVLMGFRRADRLHAKYAAAQEDGGGDTWYEDDESTMSVKKTQHVFVAATLPDYGLRSVDAFLLKKFPEATRVSMAGMHNARHRGMLRKEGGEDGVEKSGAEATVWYEMDENRERMVRLIESFRRTPDEVVPEGGLPGLKTEKVMLFLNSVNDVDGAVNGLRRAGIDAVPYHAKISLSERTTNLDRFRRYSPGDASASVKKDSAAPTPVLVCTDLASRGLDVPGVSCVVQLQFALNVVAHLHRMGRCGRAANRNGRGIVFYGSNERELVDVVRAAEEEQGQMKLAQDVDEWGEDEDGAAGTVKKAFSRKRGFTKKRKKERRDARESRESSSYSSGD